MKRLVLALLLVASFQLSAQEMLVGSYNIRYKNWNDSVQGNVWAKRCQVICDQLNFMAPVIFGTQEVLYGPLMAMITSALAVMTENGAVNMKPSFIRKTS